MPSWTWSQAYGLPYAITKGAGVTTSALLRRIEALEAAGGGEPLLWLPCEVLSPYTVWVQPEAAFNPLLNTVHLRGRFMRPGNAPDVDSPRCLALPPELPPVAPYEAVLVIVVAPSPLGWTTGYLMTTDDHQIEEGFVLPSGGTGTRPTGQTSFRIEGTTLRVA